MLSARRDDSIIFYKRFAETKQKYQINPQLFYRAIIILRVGVLNFKTVTKSTELETIVTTDLGFVRQQQYLDFLHCDVIDARELGNRGQEMAAGNPGRPGHIV